MKSAALPYSSTKSHTLRPWAVLFGRTLLFILMQGLFALGFALAGSASAWEAAVAWWPLSVSLANFACLAILILLYRAEGQNYWSVFTVRRQTILGDVLVLLALFIVVGPAGYFPNVWLSTWLYGGPEAVLNFFVLPLPLWAAYACLIVFPVTQGLVELALYFAYVMPQLEGQGLAKWQAVGLPALMLGLQHAAAPLVFEPRFIVWRALMFVPFALLTGIVLRWRPRLLPYMAFIHILMSMSFAAMFLSAAY